MKPSLLIKPLFIGLGIFLLYHSVEFQDLRQRRVQVQALQFNAADYARDIWDNHLPGVLDSAYDAQALITLFNTDMAAAVKQGNTLGESRNHAYLMQGLGIVVGKDEKGIWLSITEPADRPEILIRTGRFISGNAVRDASGLVDVSAFTDTMKFNRVGAEINKIVVKEVVTPFLTNVLQAGQRLTFTGAAEVAEDATEQSRFGDLMPGTGSNRTYLMMPVVPIRMSIVE